MLILVTVVLCLSLFTSAARTPSMKDLESFLQLGKEISASIQLKCWQQCEESDNIITTSHGLEWLYKYLSKSPEYYLGNPVNAFLLVSRLDDAWHTLNETEIDIGHDLEDQISRFSDGQDSLGVSHAIFRLQDVYQLSVDYFVKGEFPGVGCSPRLTARDCYVLGYTAYNESDYYHALIWFSKSLEILNGKDKSTMNVDRIELLVVLAFTLYKQGNIWAAYNITKELVQLDPRNEQAQDNLYYYELMLTGHAADTYHKTHITNEQTFHHGDFRDDIPYMQYKKLCRGEGLSDRSLQREMVCTHRFTDGFFHLTPLKEEMMNTDPWIVVYHDAFADNVMGELKQEAVPNLSYSMVNSNNENDYVKEISKHRTSQQAFLGGSNVVNTVNRRTAEITGLSLSTAEIMQVATYTTGGHYDIHTDHTDDDEVVPPPLTVQWGNRIATAMYYMEDVAAGGYTAFPHIGAAVPPEKGAMVFWYNLKKNGEGDRRTLHAGCPVMAGTKWISNLWFHTFDNEHIRKCGLSQRE